LKNRYRNNEGQEFKIGHVKGEHTNMWWGRVKEKGKRNGYD
jgi:hypothetical protein